MNDTRSTTGVANPTSRAIGPRIDAREYAGLVVLIPTATAWESE